jgi:S1-C subfamily serine protease
VLRDGETHTVEATLERKGLPANIELLKDGVGLSFDGENWTITAMPEDSDLYQAGLREGDVLTAFNGEPFDLSVLPELLTQEDESTVTITVERDGETQDIDVPASALREVVGSLRFQFGGAGVAPAIPFGFGEPGGPGFGMMGGARLGVAFVMLDEQVAAEHDVDVTQGALITDVQADSPAAEAGLQKGDIVTAVSGDVLDEERTLRDRLLAYEPGDTVTLDVVRGGESLSIDVTLGQFEMSSGMMPFAVSPARDPGSS